MNLNERYTVLYRTFDQAEVDHVMKTLAHDVVSIVANEMSAMKIKDEGGKYDTDENAQKVMTAVFEEFADRMLGEFRTRLMLAHSEDKKNE